jgi:uncharacterized membrane protein YgdD (TMEM256/DUF423 family)
MHVQARRFCQLSAILLGLATMVGALGAHVLRARLSADHYEVLQTALHYQYFHSLGLFGVGLLLDRLRLSLLGSAGWLLFAGVALFSGSLYLVLAGAPQLVGILTPIGGLALILGWALVVYALCVSARTHG